MTLNPEMRAVLEMSSAVTSLTWDESVSAEAAREVCNAQLPAPYEINLASVEDVIISEAPRIGARLYRPQTEKVGAAIVYYHGGGWVVGSLDSYDFFCRKLAHDTGATVLSVDYRLAPEHRYPAAVDDALAGLEWLLAHAADYQIDRDRVAVAGDSAGGNLAAAVAVLARDKGVGPLRHQFLLYPVTDADFERTSYRENAEGFLLSRQWMQWFWGHYLGDRASEDAPLAAVLRTKDFSNLAPATVITAQYDPLRDEGEAYAERLQAAGVPTEYLCAPGMLHGFVTMVGVPCTEPWLAFVTTKLRVALQPAQSASATGDQ